MKRGKLKVELLGRGMAWLDTGTFSSLQKAGNFIETIQTRQGLYLACIEEIAYRKGYIDKEQLLKLAEPLKKNRLWKIFNKYSRRSWNNMKYYLFYTK